MLRAENLFKKYDTLPVLDNVSLSVAPGEMLFILGNRGTGKTTLLRALAGLTDLEAGKVFVAGEDVTRLPAQRRGVGFVAQTPALWPQMSVRENLSFDLEQQRHAPEIVRAAVDAASAFASIEFLGDRRPSQLSAGEMQLAALARALVTQPRVILLDEPFSNLPENERRKMFSEVRRVAGETGAAVVCVTGDWRLALARADRIAVFSGGKIIRTGTPLEVYRRPENRFVANFFGDTNIISGTIITTGAGEFIAKTVFGEIRGALAGDVDSEPVPGTPVDIFIRPEAMRIDTMPPEENAFAGKIISAEFFGETARCVFNATAAGRDFFVTQINPQNVMPTDSDNVFAWVAPEDVVGIV